MNNKDIESISKKISEFIALSHSKIKLDLDEIVNRHNILKNAKSQIKQSLNNQFKTLYKEHEPEIEKIR